MQVPDAIEPAVGYRVWLVDNLYNLHSINHNGFWVPGREFEATCSKHEEPPHQTCSCGIYAASSFDHLFEMGYTKRRGLFAVAENELSIAGEVNLWGGLVPGSQGWRAQFAYPKLFLIPYTLWKIALPVSEKYGVPYRLYNLERKHGGD
jgi:hypothetical protein